MNVLLIYRKEEQAFLRSLNKIHNINFLFNSQDIVIIPADESFDDEKLSIEPIVNELGRVKELAKKKSKTGINILGTLPGKLVEQGRYQDAVHVENIFRTAISESKEPITALCLYKSIPENLEDRFSEYHDLIVRRAATSTRSI
jgi:hypothetical protein